MKARAIGAGVVVAIAMVAGAYLAGSSFEREKRLTAQAEAEALKDRLAVAESHVRIGQLLGRVLTVMELTMRQDYGLALERSSALFDAIRQEMTQVSDSGLRDGLEEALGRRDAVTAGLARGDAATVDVLHGVELQLRRALNFELPPAADVTP